MAGFENSLRAASQAILKRELTESERVEFLELAGAIGMNSVEDYLYMLMVFKRNEDKVSDAIAGFKDKMEDRFDEMGLLEKKIHDTLESSISRVLGDGAREIGRDMGSHIAEGARDVLAANEEFHFLRGQTWMICLITLMTTLAYWLGTLNVLRVEGDFTFLKALLTLPAGCVAFVCASSYTVMWAFDHWRLVKRRISYKVVLALQALLLLALISRLL
ncbi:MAG: hypothetical protein LBB48_00860 [Treponema sp.]|jgi:hypothetical protein|nr:hypothetical protein [Treponema sp.]